MSQSHPESHANRTDHFASGSSWYVLKTKVRQEEICLRELRNSSIQGLCPMTLEHRWRQRDRVKVPLFPGYVFVRLALPDDYHTVRWLRGVSHLIRFGNSEPPVLDDDIVKYFANRMDNDGVIDSTPQIKPGDPVRFRTGPFKDLIGTILNVDSAKGRVLVLMELLYQATVEVDSYQIQAI